MNWERYSGNWKGSRVILVISHTVLKLWRTKKKILKLKDIFQSQELSVGISPHHAKIIMFVAFRKQASMLKQTLLLAKNEDNKSVHLIGFKTNCSGNGHESISSICLKVIVQEECGKENLGQTPGVRHYGYTVTWLKHSLPYCGDFKASEICEIAKLQKREIQCLFRETMGEVDWTKCYHLPIAQPNFCHTSCKIPEVSRPMHPQFLVPNLLYKNLCILPPPPLMEHQYVILNPEIQK